MMGVFIWAMSLKPADLVVSVASQLSGALFAVAMLLKRTRVGNAEPPSVMLSASKKSPKDLMEAARCVASQFTRLAKLDMAGVRYKGTTSALFRYCTLAREVAVTCAVLAEEDVA